MNGDNPKKAKRKKSAAKRAFMYILIATVILFPTILAIAGLAYSESDKNDGILHPTEVVLYDSEKNQLYYSDGTDGDGKSLSLLDIFDSIYTHLLPVNTIPEEALTENPISVQLTFASSVQTLECHLKPDENLYFCENQAGAQFKISADDALTFLSSEFSEPIYADAIPPTLKSFSGKTILPSSLSWNYKNVGGTYLTAKNAQTQPAHMLYQMSGGIAFEFDTPPDSATARVFEDGIMVFNNKIDKLDSLILKSDTLVDVSISATWKKSDSRSYYGDASYSFRVEVHDRATFSLDNTHIAQGEFAILTASNIINPSRIKFTSSIPDFIPKTISYDQTLYMIIPRSALPDDASEFTFSVTYGVSTSSYTITLEESPSGITQSLLYDSMNILGFNIPIDTKTAAENLFLYAKRLAPDTAQFELTKSFGESVYYNGNNIPCPFNEYTSIFGNANVMSVCAGKVVEVGSSDAMGNFVVVDLGLGLRVCYCNLSLVNVEVGGYVVAGQVIGTTGVLSSNSAEGFSLLLTHDTAPLNPNTLFK